MLSELGNLPWLYTAHEQRENIEVIIQTVERLAEVKIGALIALEQAIPLHDVVESGIVVDCEATPEMLETIFFPNNAIHDGGVIIRGDRIAYAACIFPLTQRQDLNKSLGHAAPGGDRVERGDGRAGGGGVRGKRRGFLRAQGAIDARGDARGTAGVPDVATGEAAEVGQVCGTGPQMVGARTPTAPTTAPAALPAAGATKSEAK